MQSTLYVKYPHLECMDNEWITGNQVRVLLCMLLRTMWSACLLDLKTCSMSALGANRN